MPAVNDPVGYVEWEPPAALRRYVAATWARGASSDGSVRPAEPILPDGCMDVIWDGRGLLVAGPDTRPAPSDAAAALFVGVRFRPGAGPLFLGVPADELRDQRLDLGLAWRDASFVAEELAGASSLRAAAAVLEQSLRRRLPAIGAPDLLVEAAAGDWRASPATLAAGGGITERQLHRRFVRAVGYGPKFFQRVLRFQAFLAAAASSPAVRLGEIAAQAGYADQPHLTRETRALAGLTPAELRSNRVRNVQDADP